MAPTRKQALTLGAILLVGCAAVAGVLLSGRSASGEATAPAGVEGAEAHADEAHAREAPGADHDKAGHGGGGAARPAHTEAGAGSAAPRRLLELSGEQAKQAGIEVQTAGPATLETVVEFPGEIRLDEDRTAHLVPRLAGVVEAVPARLGQTVRKGQVLAVLASPALSDQRSELLTAERRQAAARVAHQREKTLWEDRISAEQDYLQAQTALLEADIAVRNARQKLAAVGAPAASTGLNRFEIRAPFDGTLVEKHLTLGEALKEDARIFTLADLRSVSAEFNLAPKDLASVKVGQRARVSSSAFEGRAEGSIVYVGASLGEHTRAALARVTLAVADGAWRPGLPVTVAVLGGQQALPLAVPADAVQTVDRQPTVFKAVPAGFEVRPVRIGRSDGRVVEVLEGLTAGDAVASRGAFVLKSELGKDSAGHSH